MIGKLVALAAAALLLVSASPAPPQTTVPIAAERVKFPRSNPELIDKLSLINKTVNERITYVSDQEHYGIPDYWVMFPGDGKGDCEDYAITKMELMRLGGYPTVAYARIRGVMAGIQGHAILEVLLPSGEIAFLDNNANVLMTRQELERHYKFFDW